MVAAINDVVEKHLLAYGPNRKGCVLYMTEGIVEIAKELGISYDAAKKIAHSWIDQNMHGD